MTGRQSHAVELAVRLVQSGAMVKDAAARHSVEHPPGDEGCWCAAAEAGAQGEAWLRVIA